MSGWAPEDNSDFWETGTNQQQFCCLFVQLNCLKRSDKLEHQNVEAIFQDFSETVAATRWFFSQQITNKLAINYCLSLFVTL